MDVVTVVTSTKVVEFSEDELASLVRAGLVAKFGTEWAEAQVEFYDRPASWAAGPCCPAGLATLESEVDEETPADDLSRELATMSNMDDHKRAEGVLLSALRKLGRADLADAFVEARDKAGFEYGGGAK